jgi:competence protein ComEC
LLDPIPDSKPRPTFKSPLAALATCFALGIVWAHYFRAAVGIHWVLISALACILIGLILLRRSWDRLAVCFVLASMIFTGVAAARRWERRFPLNHVRYLESLGADLSEPVRLEGRVISTPYNSGYATQFDVESRRVESLGRAYRVTGKVRLRVSLEGRDASGTLSAGEIQFGDEIQASVRLRRPHVYQNPGSFDFRRWMEDIEDIYWNGTGKNLRLVEGAANAPGFRRDEFAERARQRLLLGIDNLYPPWSTEGRNGAVMKAVLWGDRTALDSGTIDDFRKTGLYHLLVIAGLHVGLLILLLEFLLKGMRFKRAARSFIMLGFLAIYAFLVEQRAPTLRATLMIAFYLVARILYRGHSSLNSLGGVALILLYIRPAWLFESGFQLSFSAALLIVGVAVPVLLRTIEPHRRALWRLDDILLDDYFSPRLAQARLDLRDLVYALRRQVDFFDRWPVLSRNLIVLPLKLLLWVANILVFSSVLQLGLLLPMVETFHRVTFAGVGLNALAIPVMTLLLALALPINLLSVASPVAAAWPAKVLSLVMTLLFDMTHLPGLAPWLSYRMPSPPMWVAVGFCCAFVLAGVAHHFAPRAACAALAACAIFVVLVAVQPFAPRLPRGTLQLTAIDCGQGEALFLVLPGGTTLLLDAGGGRTRGPGEGAFRGRRWDPGEDIVSPYLWSLGVKRIDVLAFTRAQGDDIGGLSSILENFRVGEFWHAPHPETPDYAALLEAVAVREIPTRTLLAGDVMTFSGASIRVLWPKPASVDVAVKLSPTSGHAEQRAGATLKPQSDDSLVMRVSTGRMSFLLPGDAGRDAEQGILESGGPLESQVFKLESHQARSLANRDFLARVAPRVAIVTSATGARGEGFQRSAALDALANAGVTVFRTEFDGATTVDWSGGRMVVRSYTKPEGVTIAGEVNTSLRR